MATQKVIGRNPFSRFSEITLLPAFTSTAFAATGDCAYWAGRYWNPYGTSKNIQRVCFKFGTTTITTSGLTVSLQDVDLSNGPPIRHDGTQDQTVAVAAGAISGNAWLRTGTLSATRTISPGDLVACVVEFDGSGRQGSDSIGLSNLALGTSSSRRLQSIFATKISGSYSAVSVVPNIVFEHDDGTFGTLAGALPCSVINTHGFASTTEYALPFSTPFPFTMDEIEPIVSASVSSADFNAILYQGTTSLQSINAKAKSLELAPGARSLPLPLPSQQSISANTTYYLAIGPTSANNVSVYSADVADANHLTLWPGGTNFNFATRANTGTGWTTTTTRRLFAMISAIGFDDATGGGSSGMLYIPCLNGT